MRCCHPHASATQVQDALESHPGSHPPEVLQTHAGSSGTPAGWAGEDPQSESMFMIRPCCAMITLSNGVPP
jgi:hypothetical protein